jgi:hypothetical protein
MKVELLFGAGDLSAVLRAQVEKMTQAIRAHDAARTQNTDLDTLVAEFVRIAYVEPLELEESGITSDQRPTKVDVSHRFEYAWGGPGRLEIDGIEVTLHVPFHGDPSLLRLRPSHFTFNAPHGIIRGREVVLPQSGPPQDAQRIKTDLDRALESLKQHANWSRGDVQSHNVSLAAIARTALESRRATLASVPDVASSFGFPSRQAAAPRPVVTLPSPRNPQESHGSPAREPSAPSSSAMRSGGTRTPTPSRNLLRVFLCHASQDKAEVRQLYDRLAALPVDVWLDEKKLVPGQDWHREISKAIKNVHVVVVCLTSHSVGKAGFVQKEIKYALDAADEQPEGTIFIIPARLGDCDVPDRLRQWHWVDLFEPSGFDRLTDALRLRAEALGVAWP